MECLKWKEKIEWGNKNIFVNLMDKLKKKKHRENTDQFYNKRMLIKLWEKVTFGAPKHHWRQKSQCTLGFISSETCSKFLAKNIAYPYITKIVKTSKLMNHHHSEGILTYSLNNKGFPVSVVVKYLPANAGDAGTIPESRISQDERNGNWLLNNW